MAHLDYIERDDFLGLFQQFNGAGYILNFSNRTFQEFVYEKMQMDIYQKYPSLSKAKILNAIMNDYDDVTVGKLLLELLRYMQAKDMISDENRERFKKCVDIGNRLIGKSPIAKKSSPASTAQPIKSIVDFDKYLKELTVLTDYEDSAQSRGFAFEKYLKSLFEVSGLEPRSSFKLIGEQIDGSFILHNEVYLLEAKWTSKPIDKGDLVIFNEKVSSKSGFTRGVFVSYSGYSEEALQTFANGRRVNVLLMTVQELAIALSRKMELKELLWLKVRALAEEGEFNRMIL